MPPLQAHDPPALLLQMDEVEFAEQRKQFAVQHRQDWETAKSAKDRLDKMLGHKEEFQDQIMKRRADEFAALKASSVLWLHSQLSCQYTVGCSSVMAPCHRLVCLFKWRRGSLC